MSAAVDKPPTAEELEAARSRTDVGKHPDRPLIEALLKRGRSAFWVEGWLHERYPDTEQDEETGEEVDAEDAEAMRARHVSEDAIERYRKDWLPEVAPGVDVVYDEIEDVIGRRFPGALRGPSFEVDILETVINTAQWAVGKAVAQDDEMNMVQETTLTALKTLQGAAEASVSAKQRLGLPGYEPLPEHQIIETSNRNVNVELTGRVDKHGQRISNDQSMVDMANKLLSMPTDQALAIVSAAKRSSGVVEGTATDIPEPPEPPDVG